MPAFDFTKDYVLENDYVRLSPLAAAHIEPLLQWAIDPAIWTYFTENGCGQAEFTAYVQSALAKRQTRKEYPFVVYDKTQDQYAGITRLYDVLSNLGNIKIGHTWYGKPFQGTGLNKHCKYLLFEFVFEELDMKRVGFGASADNEISIRAMKSIGCQVEGFLRGFLPNSEGNGRTDIILLSILQEEWLQEGKANLKKKLKPVKPKS